MRMRAMEVSRREMEIIVSQLRIRQALRSRIPAAANYIINPGDLVRVSRETDEKYTGLTLCSRTETNSNLSIAM